MTTSPRREPAPAQAESPTTASLSSEAGPRRRSSEHPQDPAALAELGRSHLERGDHEQAVELLVRSIARRRDLASSWITLGEALEPLARLL